MISAVITAGCSKTETDDVRPEISLSFDEAFPVNCDTLWFGEPFTFRARFSDNVALGSYSIEIHDNFDHHAHSTEVTNCSFEPVKTPVNPFHLIRDFQLPAGTTTYETAVELTIPDGNGNGNFDEGDYHFFISLTDREGWSAQKGLSIKIFRRQ